MNQIEDRTDGTSLSHTRLRREPMWQVSIYSDTALKLLLEQPHEGDHLRGSIWLHDLLQGVAVLAVKEFPDVD